MTRIWYNKSFSFVYAAINLIKQQDNPQEFYLLASHTQAHARALLVAEGLKGMRDEYYPSIPSIPHLCADIPNRLSNQVSASSSPVNNL